MPGGRKKHFQGNLATRIVGSASHLRVRYHLCMAALRLAQRQPGARTVPVRIAPWPRRTLPPSPTVLKTFAPPQRNSTLRHSGVLSRRVKSHVCTASSPKSIAITSSTVHSYKKTLQQFNLLPEIILCKYECNAELNKRELVELAAKAGSAAEI